LFGSRSLKSGNFYTLTLCRSLVWSNNTGGKKKIILHNILAFTVFLINAAFVRIRDFLKIRSIPCVSFASAMLLFELQAHAINKYKSFEFL